MPAASRVLVVDTSSERALALRSVLGAAGYETAHCLSAADGVAVLERAGADVVIVAASAAAEVAPLLDMADDAAVVVQVERDRDTTRRTTTGHGRGIVSQDAEPDEILSVIEQATHEMSIRRELALLRARIAEGAAATLVGRSSAVTQLRELIGRAAASHRTILVTGEAGAGKDVVARLIHDLSERATRPFVRVRCAETSADVLERELFGVARTSTTVGSSGLLETARGGTIVLDECTALTRSLRARVARAIIDRAAPRVGGETPVSLDARVTLTARDFIVGDIRSHAESLLQGVSVLPISVPPLRDRRSDIPLLVQHFRGRLMRDHGFPPRASGAETIMALLAQEWSGNVRELEEWVEQDMYSAGDSSSNSQARSSGPEGFGVAADAAWTLEELEQRYIVHVLDQESGNQSRAAERLGIDRRTLYRKLKEYRERQRLAS